MSALDCGSCTMCCKLMAVSEIAKPACSWCPKVKIGVGCGDYEARPQSCRDFECVWLQSQKARHGEAALPPELRPDRCHVVIDVRPNGLGLVLHVDQHRPDAHKHGAVAALIDRALKRREEVVVVIGERRTLVRSEFRARA